MANRLKLLFPLLLFFSLVAVFVYTLTKEGYDPNALPSALLDKPMPEFELPALNNQLEALSKADIVNGEPFLLNVWATWCISCRVEHPYLNQLSQQGVRVLGLNYKDDEAKAEQWLKTLGDPYQLVIFDEDGKLGLDLGVYGAPETYLVDGQGIIRYKHVGVVDETVWSQTIEPIYQRIQDR